MRARERAALEASDLAVVHECESILRTIETHELTLSEVDQEEAPLGWSLEASELEAVPNIPKTTNKPAQALSLIAPPPGWS